MSPPLSRAAGQNIRSSLLGDVATYLREFGIDPLPVFERCGFDGSELQDRDLRIPVQALMTLLNTCAEITGQEDFGLRLADRRRMPDLGPIVLLLQRETTLRGALQTLAHTLHLHSNAIYMTFDEGDETAVLAMDVMTGGAGFSRHSAEMVVCAVTHMVTWMVGPGWRPEAICFRHPPKLPDRTYWHYLRCLPEFGQEFNGLVLARADLDRPVDHAHPVLRRQADAFIASLSEPGERYVYRVQQLIVLTLPQGEARAESIAGLMGTDRRTVHRRLSREGLTFSALLDRVRRELATQYVADSRKSLSEIALLLGFESLSAFSRWFRTAFGHAPSRRRSGVAG